MKYIGVVVTLCSVIYFSPLKSMGCEDWLYVSNMHDGSELSGSIAARATPSTPILAQARMIYRPSLSLRSRLMAYARHIGSILGCTLTPHVPVYGSIVVEAVPEVCSICYDKNALVATPCEHRYCQECMNTWLFKHPTCPTCRAIVTQLTHVSYVIKEH